MEKCALLQTTNGDITLPDPSDEGDEWRHSFTPSAGGAELCVDVVLRG